MAENEHTLMASATAPKNRFDRMEWAGAFGDLGTLIPFVAAYISLLKIDPYGILLGFGIAKIVSGLYYKTPFPIQPMKAIGAVATTQAAQTITLNLTIRPRQLKQFFRSQRTEQAGNETPPPARQRLAGVAHQFVFFAADPDKWRMFVTGLGQLDTERLIGRRAFLEQRAELSAQHRALDQHGYFGIRQP
jgi:hypothetical protein